MGTLGMSTRTVIGHSRSETRTLLIPALSMGYVDQKGSLR